MLYVNRPSLLKSSKIPTFHLYKLPLCASKTRSLCTASPAPYGLNKPVLILPMQFRQKKNLSRGMCLLFLRLNLYSVTSLYVSLWSKVPHVFGYVFPSSSISFITCLIKECWHLKTCLRLGEAGRMHRVPVANGRRLLQEPKPVQ